MDHTVHVVDLMRWIMRAEATRVYAVTGRLNNELEVEDCGLLTIEFDNGVFATLDCSWSRNPTYPTWGDVTLEIVGTDGILTVDAFNQKTELYSNTEGYKYRPWGDSMDVALIQDFIQSIRLGLSTPSITGEDGLRAVEVALAAYESARNGEVVALSRK